MAKAQRGTSKLKKSGGARAPHVRLDPPPLKKARTSVARLRQHPHPHHEERSEPKNAGRRRDDPSARESPPVLPVRTAMTPRPDLTIPVISVQNVDWEDGREPLSPLDKWEQAERALERRLIELGVVPQQHRFEPKEGRLVWLDDAHVPVAEARAQVIASWVFGGQGYEQDPAALGRLVMAWADPMVVAVAVAKLDEMGDSLPVDRATARDLVLSAGEASGAEFIHRLVAPHGEHYLALRTLRPALAAAPVTPGSPVGTVLRGLADLRRSVSQRDEPTDVLRARFLSLGKTMLGQSEGPYRDTEWVGRLQRAGRVLNQLAGRLVPPTFSAIAAGRQADEWLAQSVAVDLIDAVKLLEDEWGAFA